MEPQNQDDGSALRKRNFADVTWRVVVWNYRPCRCLIRVLVKFRTEDEVIEMANDSVYGLSSNLFTQNLTRAIRVTNALETGTTFVCVSLSILASEYSLDSM